VNKSYLLINGSSGGILASILATVQKGKKIIMARNCHKSVFNALILADIQPLYVYPQIIEEYGISGEITVDEIERLLSENTEVEAVILPSPNYYGICSDIDTIAKVVHNYNKILIVDQAHGAHLKLFENYGIKGLPKSAEESGADIIINSTHKTLASMTQSAVLNLKSNRVDRDMLEDKLQCVQSSSPSYILMVSLDINRKIIENHGFQLMKEWANNLNYFYNETKSINGLKVINNLDNFDFTKINLDMSEIGISGTELEQLLLKENIFIELTTGNIAMCMTGIGNKRNDFIKLLNVIQNISTTYKGKNEEASKIAFTKEAFPKQPKFYEIPKIKRRVKLTKAEGSICARSIIPYPPGIPLICPGEKIEADVIAYIKTLRDCGYKIIGINEQEEILIG
jgi:arginine/lysine/ornithine decarboxylase